MVRNSTEELLEIQFNFYSKVYSSVRIEEESKKHFLSFVKKRLDESDVEICDRSICNEEIVKAVKEMANNKSPGSGLTVEFYKMFLPYLRDVLFKLFKEIETKETLSHTIKMGVITLIYKKKGDKKLLKIWRPISLLNVDYKIIARVMANRLKLVLPNIVSESQTCCITVRDIADKLVRVRYTIDLV